jgi:protein associated with RNAse G/E
MIKLMMILSLVMIMILPGCKNSNDTKIILTPESVSDVQSAEFREYYFPVDSFIEPKIYHYASEGDINPDMYWVLSTIQENEKTFLLTDSYALQPDGKFKNVEKIKEEIKADGAYVLEYAEFQKDQNGVTYPAEAVITNSCVFMWNMKTTEPLIWSFEITNKDNTAVLQKTNKTRYYRGNKSDIIFENDTLQAIEFTDDFHLEMVNTVNGRNKVYDFSQTSYYTQNIGMYKYVRDVDDKQYVYTLTEILSNDEWLEIFIKSE